MKIAKRLLIIAATVIMLCVISVAASAETYGDLSYRIDNGEVTITGCKGKDYNVTIEIPAEIYGYPVTSIGDSAFYGFRALSSITIPDSITIIGYRAFAFCRALESVTIPDSVKSIGDSAFEYCNALESVTIPDSVKSIGDSAFEYCDALESVIIPDSVTSIGDRAFAACKKIACITIPDSITSIGRATFAYCYDLTNITIPESVTSIGDSAFERAGLASITIPDSVISIGSSAFYNCDGLTSVTIPDSVTSIGDGAFKDCTGLTKINWNAKNVEDFDDDSNVFYNAGTLSEGIELTFGDNVERIPKYAFNECNITSVIIGNSVTSIGDHAFQNCRSLSSVTIPDSVTSIGELAFSYTGLTSITIANSVTSIGKSAFYNCTSLTKINWNAKNVNDFDENSNVFKRAGESGEGIELTFGDNVERIPKYAFDDCKGLKKINWNAKNVNDFDENSNVFKWAGESGEGIEVIFGDNVKRIPAYSFYVCNVTSVTIGNSVTSIGDHAFHNCDGLTSVTIPNSVTSIGNYAFAYCYELTNIAIPESVTSIGYYAFSSCDGLESVYIADIAAWCSIEFGSSDANPMCYAEELYVNNELLTELVIPDSVTSISDNAFHNCDGLTSVTIPNSVTSIGSGAFSDCDRLTSITIPDSVTSIGVSAFANCDGLTSITIGKSVTIIDAYAFYDCDHFLDEYYNPYNVYFTGTEEEWNNIVIGSYNDALKNVKFKIEFVLGDINGDAKVTTADARLVLRIAVGLEALESYSVPLEAVDMNKDGKLATSDARIVLRKAVGLE